MTRSDSIIQKDTQSKESKNIGRSNSQSFENILSLRKARTLEDLVLNHSKNTQSKESKNIGRSDSQSFERILSLRKTRTLEDPILNYSKGYSV